MKKDRFSTTIELVLLICFTLASVLFLMELYIGDYASFLTTLLIGGGLIIVLLLLFVWVNRAKTFVVLRRISICLLTLGLFGFTIHSNFQRTQSSIDQNLMNYHQLRLLTFDSTITTSSAFESKSIGTIRSDRSYVQGYIENQDDSTFEDVNLIEYADFDLLHEAMIKKDIQGALVSTLNYEILCRDHFFITHHQVIGEYNYQSKMTHQIHEIDVSKEPFTVFVSIMLNDEKVEIANRNDVNFIVYLNPYQRNMHVQFLPHDLYVPNLAYDGYSDRLDHLGYSGMDNVLFSLESMFGFEFDYFMKLNLSSIEYVTQALGGIEVVLDEAFCKKSEACLSSLNLSLNENNIRSYIESLKEYPEIFLHLFQGFFEKKQALNLKPDSNLLQTTNTYVFSDIHTSTLMKMQNNYVDNEWTYSDEIIDPSLKVEAPCISWDFYDLQQVSIIDASTAAQVYEHYLMNEDLTEMSRFAISLDQLHHDHVLPKFNEDVVNAVNAREKITAFYTILPNITIAPIETNKWNDPILNEAHFDPSQQVEDIQKYTEKE